MNGKQIRVSSDLYSDIQNIRKKLIEKGGLHRDLTMRETLDIIWNIKGDHGISLEEAIIKIRESNMKIAWGSHGRGTKRHRKGSLQVNIIPAVTQVNK